MPEQEYRTPRVLIKEAELLSGTNDFVRDYYCGRATTGNIGLGDCASHLRTLMERSSAFMEIVNKAKLSLQNKDDVAATKPKYFLDFIINL